MLTSLNPLTGETLGQVPIASPENVFEKIQIARKAQVEWCALPLPERARFIRRFMRGLALDAESFSEIITKETGKSPVDSLTGEIFPSLLYIDYVCKNAPKLLKERKISSGFLFTNESRVQCVPYGVVGIVSPWNFPVYITLGSAIAALAAGNAVITKPSEFTPLSVLHLNELFEKAGFPSGIFQVVPGNAATGQALIDGRVDRFVFTGSTATGKKVAAACAEKLIPFTLELGGKDPMIVLDDAPMPRAIHGALYASLCYSGQMCVSVERLYVEKPIAKTFIENLVKEAGRLRSAEIGPIQNKPQAAKIQLQIENAVNDGAAVLTGGKMHGAIFEPTILLDVPEKSSLMNEETFGPVLAIKVVENEDEAIRLANQSQYGLTASVWSKNRERAENVASRLEAGSVFINDHISPSVNPHAPWGGTKESGIGTERGEWGLYSMVRVRHVSRNRFLFSKDPFWFPRTTRQKKLALALIQGLFGTGFFKRLKGFFGLFCSSR